MIRYRIEKIKSGYIIEKRVFFGWESVKEWLGCDPLGFDYGFGDISFKSVEDAENYIKNIL